ncbi:hypothetical protein RF847_004628 [Salmonella enterica]|nr:hypothetical protein [Salmonella enterica]
MATRIEQNDIEHSPINVLLTIENGKVIHSRMLQSSEFVASMETFLWMAERAGYKVTPPEREEINVTDGDTGSSVGSSEGN